MTTLALATTVVTAQAARTRRDLLTVLRAHKPELNRQFGVEHLALFGSFSRDEATDDSDVDILIRFRGRGTPRSFFGTQSYLEDLLGRRVDLVTDKALRPEFRPYVEAEAIDV